MRMSAFLEFSAVPALSKNGTPEGKQFTKMLQSTMAIEIAIKDLLMLKKYKH